MIYRMSCSSMFFRNCTRLENTDKHHSERFSVLAAYRLGIVFYRATGSVARYRAGDAAGKERSPVKSIKTIVDTYPVLGSIMLLF
jgi:hypothetical protein